ncbi:hypothetical protein BH09BAC1_BH09BAC1_15680 [soil metagenome]
MLCLTATLLHIYIQMFEVYFYGILPNITDWIQSIAAAISIPGAVAAFYILFKKDKEREAEVKSLVKIADQLTKMQIDSEKRYKASKRPHILIESRHLNETNIIEATFTNSNSVSTLNSFNAKISGTSDCELSTPAISQEGHQQKFYVLIRYPTTPPKLFTLIMDYRTEEGYEFVQTIICTFKNPDYRFDGKAIMDKSILSRE